MEVSSQVVIEQLLEEIKQLQKDKAVLKAQIVEIYRKAQEAQEDSSE